MSIDHTTGPRIGSVCTGYGGLDLAVELVFGGRLAWCAETDRYAITVLAHHWPGVANLGDIRTVQSRTASRERMFRRRSIITMKCGQCRQIIRVPIRERS
ncbi:hypothetical protein AB0I61_35410 [Polymorphospora rubra]|uniref:hypothetical protein n=1 Tax=Polymorphospora rubra TaxID=338584 RepID=UPI0033F08781